MGQFDFLLEERPWTKKDINSLGDYFAGTGEKPGNAAEILLWYDELARQTASACEAFAREFFDEGWWRPEITSAFRVKSQTSISEKIRRTEKDPSAKVRLDRMWDFAGARITANVLHSDLRFLSSEFQRVFEEAGLRVSMRDYLSRPQLGGYRALHLVIHAAAGNVELQIRTLLQSEWANTFEKVADKTGRRLRYERDYRPSNQELADIADELEEIAARIYRMEQRTESTIRRNVASLRLLAEGPRGIPLNPEVHFLRVKALKELADSEIATSNQASSILALIAALRGLEQTIDVFEPESEGYQ